MGKKHKNKNVNVEININNQNREYIKDESTHIHQKSKLKCNLNIRYRKDLTEKQHKLIDLILDKKTKIIFINGPAGVSKSFISILTALELLNKKLISDILYLRSAIESSDHSLGYLKGDLSEKVSVYLTPLMDKLDELLSKQEVDMLIREERILGQPINFVRGCHWAVKGVILDEAQNCSYRELFSIITRMGEHSKLFILGDTQQCDIKNSGFEKMMNLLNDDESRSQGIFTFTFTEDDVVRSELVKFLLKKLKS